MNLLRGTGNIFSLVRFTYGTHLRDPELAEAQILHTHLLEFACAVGGDKYRTILESFLVTERTCPDMDLLSMISAWKVHCGSFYGARDEYQEFCHLMLAKHLVHSPGLSWKLNCALSEFPPWIYIIIFYSKHSR